MIWWWSQACCVSKGDYVAKHIKQINLKSRNIVKINLSFIIHKGKLKAREGKYLLNYMEKNVKIDPKSSDFYIKLTFWGCHEKLLLQSLCRQDYWYYHYSVLPAFLTIKNNLQKVLSKHLLNPWMISLKNKAIFPTFIFTGNTIKEKK